MRARVVVEERAHGFAPTVGNAIRAHRGARGMTQAELATAAGISANYVARLERGEMAPSLEVAQRISRALAISLDELVADVT